MLAFVGMIFILSVSTVGITETIHKYVKDPKPIIEVDYKMLDELDGNYDEL